MGDTGADVTGGVQSVAGQAAQGHTDGDDDAEDQQVADAGGSCTGNALDGEDQDEGSDSFTEDVAGDVGDGGAGGEDAQLGAGILGGIELILEHQVNDDSTDDGACELSNDVAGNQAPGQGTLSCQSDGQSGVEVSAGSSAEDECGNHDGKTPGQGDLDGACALHAGLVQGDVCNDAVAQQDQQHSAKKFSNIRQHNLSSY